ncbi:MAG: MFS transporter [Gemmatimonadetes bacterium]|nr:MAG: MFS transporter [Gemmatimonadota bacterium]
MSDPGSDGRSGRPPGLGRNVWATSVTSFLTDVSSEMVTNVLPLFLANVLGVRTVTIGLIEGAAESIASFVKLYAGVWSDRLRRRKPLAVLGYAVSAASKPFYLIAGSWGAVAGIRWSDRVGKGVRTAPRDALLADSVPPERRGLAFGFHRAADTAGAVVGLLVAVAVVEAAAGGALRLDGDTFRLLVLASLPPAFLAVLVLAVWARDVGRGVGADERVSVGAAGGPGADGSPAAASPHGSKPARGATATRPRGSVRQLGRPFLAFLAAAALFDLGNSADAFLVLRAQDRGLGVSDVLWVLLAFNVVYTVVSTPAGRWSDRIGRRPVLLVGWAVYALAYGLFAVAGSAHMVVGGFLLYGVYYGLATGTAKAFVADLVAPERRATAYGAYHAVLGFLNLPASLIAGLLWQGWGGWAGFGAAAPFVFGAATAGLAALALVLWVPGGRTDANAV